MRRDPRRFLGAWKPKHLQGIPTGAPFDDLCRVAGASAGDKALDVLRYFAHSDQPAARAAAVQGIEYLFETSPALSGKALLVLNDMRSTEKVGVIKASLELLIEELTNRRNGLPVKMFPRCELDGD
jgi:hypothetical protein